jgi:hypothetical protein
MDGRTFDVLVKWAGQACTRRLAISGLAAALFGLGRATRVAAEVETAGCAKKGDDCLNNYGCCEGLKCRVPDGEEIGTCVTKNNSDKRCKRDRDCKKGEECRNRRCKNKDNKGGDGRKGDRCRQDRDCKSGLKCKRDRCEDDNSCGRERDRCKTNGDCCNALICDRGDNRCRK